MTKKAEMTMVDEAVKTQGQAVETVRTAETALREAGDQLRAALVERDRLDKELDGGADIDAADLAAQIGANQTTVEALTRLRERREATLVKARETAEVARKRVTLARLRELADDIDAFDVEAEKARLIAAVQDQYSELLDRLYGFQDRIAEARRWAEDAQGLGVGVTVPPRFNTSVPVEVDGRSLIAPAQVSGVSDWLAKGLVDERAEARARRAEEANRARYRDAHAAQAAYQQALGDSMRREYGDAAEKMAKGQRR